MMKKPQGLKYTQVKMQVKKANQKSEDDCMDSELYSVGVGHICLLPSLPAFDLIYFWVGSTVE